MTIRMFLALQMLVTVSSLAAVSEVFFAHLRGWYPTDRSALQKKLNELDAAAFRRYSVQADPRKIRAVIVPHAGYDYSGQIAASAFRLLKKGDFSRVIILAPSHTTAFSGVALPHFLHYQTPLGSISMDQTVVNALRKKDLFSVREDVWSQEHSLEIELPFLQYYLENFKLVPLIIGAARDEQVRSIAQELKKYVDANTLIVVSSDFTHYGRRFGFTPFNNEFQNRIRLLDSGAVQAIESKSVKNFLSFRERTKATICGRIPITILLAMFEQNTFGDLETRLISYATSYEVAKHVDDSVSYLSLFFTQEKRASLPLDKQLTAYEKQTLVKFARDILENSFTQKIDRSLLTPILSGILKESMGAFVTLYKPGKKLRGCIGRIVTSDPLYKTIADMTLAAAFKDSRFQPVKQEELKLITIDISVLTKPRQIASYQDIKIGVHGVIMERNNRSAVFLPHVPTDFGWDLPTMLRELSKKAGLESAAWQDPAVRFQVFETIEFSE